MPVWTELNDGSRLAEHGDSAGQLVAIYQVIYFFALVLPTEVTESIYEQLPEMMKPMFRLLTDEELEESKLWVVEDERTTNN